MDAAPRPDRLRRNRLNLAVYPTHLGQFFDAGLLDELIVQVGSMTLGQGKPLFPHRLTSPPLTLVSVRQMGTGFAELRYQVPAQSAPTTHIDRPS